METWDCFTYFNEEEILRIRLEELNHAVDHFVIVEGDHTFTGKPKRTYFDDIGEWIDPYKGKIVRVLYSSHHPPTNDAWSMETRQRNAIMSGLKDADPHDVVIISDVDEIPKSHAIAYSDKPYQLGITQFFWGPNWQVPAHCNQAACPVVTQKKDITTPQQMREGSFAKVPNAAWHFSFSCLFS